MSPNIGEAQPRVNPEGPTKVRARGDDRPKGRGFTRTPHDVLAMTDLSDAGARLWSVIQHWTWRGALPENWEIAAKCGWFTPDGEPSRSKVKRIMKELEALGLVEREVSETGWRVRTSLKVHRAMPPTKASKFGPPRGTEMDRPVVQKWTAPRGPNLDHSSKDRCRKSAQDPLRSRGEGEGSPRTTTIPPAKPDPELTPEAAAEQPRTTTGDEVCGSHREEPPGEPEAVPPLDEMRERIGRPEGPPRASAPPPGRPRASSSREEAPPDPIDPDTLTPRRRTFVESLTADQRSRLDAMTPRSREGVLRPIDYTDDPGIYAKHAADHLREPGPRIRVPTPDDDIGSLFDALGRHPEAISAIMIRLARDFGDFASVKGFKARIEEVATGKRDVESLREAYRQAMGPKCRNRGAIFNTALANWTPRGRTACAV